MIAFLYFIFLSFVYVTRWRIAGTKKEKNKSTTQFYNNFPIPFITRTMTKGGQYDKKFFLRSNAPYSR